MTERRRLRRLFLRHTPAERRLLRAHYRALDERYGPFDAVTKAYALAETAMWWGFELATAAVMEGEQKRREGKRRRPAAQAVERLRKRQGLAYGSFDQALRRLEELARPTRKAASPADVMRKLRAGAGASVSG